MLASSIDSSLETLHTKLFEEFFQSRMLLARTRNKISSRAYSLPNEVLADIFMNVVYTPGPHEFYVPSMKDGLRRMFGRLYSLLAVCTTWRNVGLGLSKLWSVIPLGDKKTIQPTPEATSLVLQQSHAWNSGHRPLHLAAVLSNRYTSVPPLLEERAPRFTSINIEARHKSPAMNITTLLESLIKTQTPSILSELSIHQYHDLMEDELRPCLPQVHEYLGFRMSAQERDLFTTLIGSLATFRLKRANIHWNTITFSDKLVNLHLQSVVLGDPTKLNEFLHALESAPELRDVKLISVVAFIPSSRHGNPPPVKISLPKLQSLLLHDLTFNIVKHVLASISPGSHRLKVGMSGKSYYNCLPNGKLDKSDSQPILSLLNRSGIDTLFLTPNDCDSRYVDYDRLHTILKYLPCLKTLIMSDWKWERGSIPALERPVSGAPFPTLSEIYITCGFVYEVNLLPRIAASHSLQTLVLDHHSSLALTFDGAEHTIQELKSRVPDFRLVKSIEDFSHEVWPLW
ncbi:hypothetical protein RSOL_401690, partial [Rhizoctonia solani AG-3 Rhs1AP]